MYIPIARQLDRQTHRHTHTIKNKSLKVAWNELFAKSAIRKQHILCNLTELIFLIVLEARRLSRCQQDWLLLRPVSLVCRRQPTFLLCPNIVIPLGLWDLIRAALTASSKEPISKHSHIVSTGSYSYQWAEIQLTPNISTKYLNGWKAVLPI